MLNLYDLTTEYKTDPLGLDDPQPRFSWKLQSDKQDTRQSAFRLTVSGDGQMWDTGWVESEQSILVEYGGEDLTPCTTYTWTVIVWDNHGEQAEAVASFETGLLSGVAFAGKARWITHSLDRDETASPIFTKSFIVSKPVAKARLYATALGLYEAELNGVKLDDSYFTPGWTSYHKRLQYQTYAADGLRQRLVCWGAGLYPGAKPLRRYDRTAGDAGAELCRRH